MSWLALAVLTAIGVALFVIPHRTDTDIAEKRSLGGCFSGLVRSRDFGGRGGKKLLRFGFGYGCLAVFLPVVVGVLLRLAAAADQGFVLLLGAVALALGAVLLFLVLLLSHMNWAFGGSQRSTRTAVARLAPIYVTACAVLALVAVFSRGVRSWLLSA